MVLGCLIKSASDSSDDGPRLVIGEEEDSFELQKINEEDEFYLDD